MHNVLFLTPGNFQPQGVVKSLVPSSNTLVLFEVSPVSFHQVGRRRRRRFFRAFVGFLFLTPVSRVCVRRGRGGSDQGQVSPVPERLVPRAVLGAPPPPRRGPHSTEPAFTERRKPGADLFNHALRLNTE